MTTQPEYPPYTLPAEANDIIELVHAHQKFLIVGHLRPDGDCFGSCLGLYEALRLLGKQVRFFTAGPLPESFAYLPHFDKTETTLPPADQFDATIYVDTADENRVFQGHQAQGLSAVIDHHISNSRYATHNWVDDAATSAAEMVYHFVKALGVDITPEIATCLYTGQMTDTGGFRFGNTSEMTFRVASHLVASGANPAFIAEKVWDSRSPANVKISALVLSTLNYEFDGHFVWNEVTQAMMDETGNRDAEPEGLSSEMRSIAGVDIAVLFYQTKEDYCRIGFRSRGDLNVSQLASLLNGGGHRNASGALVMQPYPQAKSHALQVIREYLTTHYAG